MGPRGRGGWGFGPWAFGFGGCEPQAGPGFRWRFYDRGDLKYVILRLLREKPMHGYEVMRALEEQSGGCYRARDRKSTRLNSSHGYISYAVFCLKKKKTKENKQKGGKVTCNYALKTTTTHS